MFSLTSHTLLEGVNLYIGESPKIRKQNMMRIKGIKRIKNAVVKNVLITWCTRTSPSVQGYVVEVCDYAEEEVLKYDRETWLIIPSSNRIPNIHILLIYKLSLP